jgi:hypothetical protein
MPNFYTHLLEEEADSLGRGPYSFEEEEISPAKALHPGRRQMTTG